MIAEAKKENQSVSNFSRCEVNSKIKDSTRRSSKPVRRVLSEKRSFENALEGQGTSKLYKLIQESSKRALANAISNSKLGWPFSNSKDAFSEVGHIHPDLYTQEFDQNTGPDLEEGLYQKRSELRTKKRLMSITPDETEELKQINKQIENSQIQSCSALTHELHEVQKLQEKLEKIVQLLG